MNILSCIEGLSELNELLLLYFIFDVLHILSQFDLQLTQF